MKAKHVIALVSLLLAVTSTQVMGQQHEPIARPGPIIPEIWSGQLDHELVAVEGFVEFWEEVPHTTVIKYHLRDKWANIISVMSPNERPVVKTVLYRVIGTVNVISETSERFIDERTRMVIEGGSPRPDQKELAINAINSAVPVVEERSKQWWIDNKPAEACLKSANLSFAAGSFDKAVTDANQAVVLSANPSFSTIFYFVIAAVVVLIVLAVALVIAAVKRPRVGTVKTSTGEKRQPESSLPPPAEKIKGDAISMDLPPSGTLKILPGRLEVIGGDSKVAEIRLYRTSENTDLEFTFGRFTGSPYRHIQIDHPTISHEQAKLLFSNGVYTLINRADPVKSNSTMVNDVEMQMNQVCTLKDNDKIAMGAVIMRYHANGK